MNSRALSSFRFGYQHDLVARMPVIKRLPERGVRSEFFLREEMDLLLPCLPEYLRDVALFGFLTGWRKGEILGLRWSNVDRSGAVIRLEPEQNKGRVGPPNLPLDSVYSLCFQKHSGTVPKAAGNAKPYFTENCGQFRLVKYRGKCPKTSG